MKYLTMLRFLRLLIGGYWIRHRYHGWFPVGYARYNAERRCPGGNVIDTDDCTDNVDAWAWLLIGFLCACVFLVVAVRWM